MPSSNPELISALRTTADRLDSGAQYEWGHLARCNCGHLVQTITGMTDTEISCSVDHQLAEWSEHAESFCAGTNIKVDDLFRTLDNVGFSHRDVMSLENLSDGKVLNRLPEGRRHLRRNDVSDVTLYMRTLASILEEEASPQTQLSS
ncbi:MAG: hypothetical protein AB8G99_17315 [Planctomycetaceae bacterium]